MTPPIVVLGDVCLHVTIRSSGPDEFCTGDVELGPGGSSAMVALQIAALGRRVTMIGVAGADDLGQGLRGRVAAAGVDCTRWTSVPGATARVAVLVEPGGDHRVVVAQGAVTEPGRVLATALDEVSVPDGAWCYVPGFPGYDQVRTALADRPVRLVCDFGFRPWLTDVRTARENVVPRVDGVAVAVCSGGSFAETANRALAGACLDQGASAVVTSLGPAGCLMSDASGTTYVPGFAAEPVNRGPMESINTCAKRDACERRMPSS